MLMSGVRSRPDSLRGACSLGRSFARIAAVEGAHRRPEPVGRSVDAKGATATLSRARRPTRLPWPSGTRRTCLPILWERGERGDPATTEISLVVPSCYHPLVIRRGSESRHTCCGLPVRNTTRDPGHGCTAARTSARRLRQTEREPDLGSCLHLAVFQRDGQTRNSSRAPTEACIERWPTGCVLSDCGFT